MLNYKYVIGISSIGSGIGQSIIRSCKLSCLPLYTIGFGNNPYGFGVYDCDFFEMVPAIQEDNYISTLIQKCVDNKVDVLIPSHDLELLLFAENHALFLKAGIQTIVSDKELIQIGRNKESIGNYFGPSKNNIFVKSYKLDEILNSDQGYQIKFPLIAKPRNGYGSRNIRIIDSIEQIKDLSPDFILQELAMPAPSDINYQNYIHAINNSSNLQVSEISVQLIANKESHLIGRMASYNKLENGGPTEILPIDAPIIWDAIDSITSQLSELGLKGPLNIQGRITQQGFKIFEMNPRFTLMTSLRALIGFNEVDACIRSWLDLPIPSLNVNFNRFGLRQTLYRAVDLKRNKQVHEHSVYINKGINKRKDNVLITGATGFLGRHLMQLLDSNKYDIAILSQDKQRAQKILFNYAVKFYDYSDIDKSEYSFGNIDILIHLGFKRSEHDYQEIADSLKTTSNIFNLALLHQVPAIINISSQSVYGLDKPPLWREECKASPENPYAQAKYASELMLRILTSFEHQVKGTSLRLASLTGGSIAHDSKELIYKLVDQVINRQQIYIKGGQQLFERLDARDAAQAIVNLMEIPSAKWKPVYNLGCNKNYRLFDIAERVIRISEQYNIAYPYQLIVNSSDDRFSQGMSSSLFMSDVNWSPKFELDDIIRSIFERRIRTDRGNLL